MSHQQLQIDFTIPLVHYENNVESQNHFNENIEHFSNQCKKVYKALMRGERLTAKIAMNDYGIGHLARRIKDLTDIYKVPNIESEFVNNYKEYFIKKIN